MFLDIGVGVLAGIFFQTGTTFSWYFFVFALVSALLPDIDMLWYWYAKKYRTSKVLDNHRSITHYPVVYIPVVLVLYFYFGFHIAIVFSLLVLYHLVHDTFFIGWGVKWFWPVSQRSFKIFPDRNGKVTGKLMLSWLPNEEQKIKEWAGSSNWMKAFYMTPNVITYIEYPIFLIAIYFFIRLFI
jgi:hypothetical protein